MIEIILYIATLLISITVVGGAADNGWLNSALTRAFGGIGTQVVSLNVLNQYTNFETFIRGCINGQVGISGYAFILAFGILLLVWANNIINYKQAIV